MRLTGSIASDFLRVPAVAMRWLFPVIVVLSIYLFLRGHDLPGGGFIAGLVRGAFKNVPLEVNLSIRGPFRALIQTAKAFRDPTVIIQPVMPFPLDAPGIVTETRTLRKEEDQDRITPLAEVETTPPPTPTER